MPSNDKKIKKIQSDKKKEEIIKKEPTKKDLLELGNQIANYRKKPLLIMYYCDDAGQIIPYDVKHIYSKHLKPNIKESLEELDILLHTMGGHPNSAYLLIQTIRKFAKKINLLIPNHSYSAGTLMALGCDNLIMGIYASLSPIDVQIFGGRFPLLSIQKYVEFVRYVRDSLIACGDPHCKVHNPNSTAYENLSKDLLLELAKEFDPSDIGQLFNLRKLSEYYGKILLNDYMLRNQEKRKEIVERIINRLNSDHPAHNFDIDFEIASGLGLTTELMDSKLFEMTDMFIYLCDFCKKQGDICEYVPRDKLEDKESDYRVPYFRLILPNGKKEEVDKNDKKGEK